jgi:ceramide glucosyltransferase
LIEALAVETVFVPGVLLTNCFSDLQFAFGASIAVDRRTFSEIGGFEVIEDYLADDYKIGNLVYKGNPAQMDSVHSQSPATASTGSACRKGVSGKRIVLSPYVVSIIPPGEGLFSALNHIVRWNRTVRICKPVGYFFSVVCHSCFWALMCFITAGGSIIGWATLTATCLVRIVTAMAFVTLIRSKSGILKTLLTPLWDVVSVILWGVGLMGSTVTWRGVRYKILRGGKLKEI